MQIQEKIKLIPQIDYGDIEDDRLLAILNCVSNGDGVPDFVLDSEKSILMGTLVDRWGGHFCLTELGRVFLAELAFRSIRSYRGDE